MKKSPLHIITVLVLIIGIIGTLFSFAVFIKGTKADAFVTQVKRNTHNTAVTYSYEYNGETYTRSKKYKRNKKVSEGDKKKIYFFESAPDKGFTMDTFIVFYFIVILTAPMTYVLFRKD
ncbi:MAG TPA: hypothetical protein DCZ71_03890 [Ruminococcus sp.]|nr:hypothetical protein [Ruminococcus sp.]